MSIVTDVRATGRWSLGYKFGVWGDRDHGGCFETSWDFAFTERIIVLYITTV